MIRGVGIAVSETIGGESNQIGLRVDEVHLLGPLLLWTEAGESTLARLGGVLLGLDAVQNVLSLGLVVDAGIITPTVRGKDERSNEVELTIAGCTLGITGTIGLTTPGKIALAIATLVLHILLAPAPQTVEDILLAKLHGYHHAIRHTLGTGIVVLDIRHIAHRIAYLEVDLIGATENIVKNLMQLSLYLSMMIA